MNKNIDPILFHFKVNLQTMLLFKNRIELIFRFNNTTQ